MFYSSSSVVGKYSKPAKLVKLQFSSGNYLIKTLINPIRHLCSIGYSKINPIRHLCLFGYFKIKSE